MDRHEELAARGYIPRLPTSKLPMPRAMASYDNLKQSARTSTTSLTVSAHPDDLFKRSHLPRPSGPAGPLGENVNQSIRARYGWASNSTKPRSASPVRDALRDASVLAMDTTPPSSIPDVGAPVFDDENENPLPADTDPKERRRPRPSLSERTIETLSQMSPTPSPAARKPSLFGADLSMAPPPRPASSMRESRDSTPATSRPGSASSRAFLPPGRLSPTKDLSALPPILSAGEISAPPKAVVKGARSKIAKPLRDPRRSASSALEAQQQAEGARQPSRTFAQTMKVKPTFRQMTSTWHWSGSKPAQPLASIFAEPTPADRPSGELAVSSFDSGSTLLKPRSSNNPNTPLTPSSRSPTKRKPTSAAQTGQSITTIEDESKSTRSPKSSIALRETIAKAKAARRKVLESSGTPAVQSLMADVWTPSFDQEVIQSGNHRGLLLNRTRQAVTSGHLNIAGMKLTQVPSEVMKMYESGSGTANWSEMVDLVKMNAGDNELEMIDDDVFPDYTKSDLEDDEKYNQFGGLEFLDLHRNCLRSIPIGLRRLERLQTLNLSGNKLTRRAFDVIGQIPHLKELMLAENLIEGTLDFGNCGPLEHLQILDLHGNGLDHVNPASLSQVPNLKVLNIADNKLRTVPWEVLSSLPLTEINVSKNRLCDVLFANGAFSRELRILDVSHNDLEGIGETSIDASNLRSLILSGNRIRKLPALKNYKELQTIEVSDNLLEEIPSDFGQLGGLKSADFGNNNIRLIPSEIARLQHLSSLNLAGNPLREKKYLTMGTAELKSDLENKLGSASAEVSSSETAIPPSHDSTEQYRYTPSRGILDLSSQSLATINLGDIDLNESGFPIHTLKLSNNDLSEFPTELILHPALKDSLQSLDLSHNPALNPTEYLSSELFLPRLKSLYIVSTGLASLEALSTYLKAPVLTELNISCHRLAGDVPRVRTWWPECRVLLATDNWFSSVGVESVRGLEALDIRNNEIESLPPKIGLLGNHPSSSSMPGRLRVLEVSGNRFRVPRLAVVEKGTEAVLKDLRRMIPTDDVPEEWRDVV